MKSCANKQLSMIMLIILFISIMMPTYPVQAANSSQLNYDNQTNATINDKSQINQAQENGSTENTTTSAPAIDPNVVDTDITYPAPPSSSNQLLVNNSVNSILNGKNANTSNSGVFFRRVSHMPKFEEKPVSFTANPSESTSDKNISANDNSVSSVAATVYQNDSVSAEVSSTGENVANSVYHSNELVIDNQIKNDNSVSNSVYKAYTIKNKAGYYNVG